MSTNGVNKISEDLYNLMFCLHNKIFHPNEAIKNLPLPPSHVRVIFYLARHGIASISDTAKKLGVSKPNMTPIIDKLITEGMVDRSNDPTDRRVLRIELTDKAHEFIKEQEKAMQDNLAKKISSLGSEDLKALGEHVIGIISIISKIE